jgi:uncharacterized protein YggE
VKVIAIIGAAVLLFAAAGFAGIARPEASRSASETTSGGITVTGTGEVETVPNEAEFSIGVRTTGETAREALTANSAQMRRLIDALKAAGVADSDIKTQDVSDSPDYEPSNKDGAYTARNSASVRIRDLGRASAVLDAASQAGANEVYGPMLSRSNREALENRALADAVANARERAEALAEAAGVSLGEVTAITDQPEYGGPVYAMTEARAATDAKAPIEPGTEKVTAAVTVTFAIG